MIFEKTVLYRPLGGDTAPEVVPVFSHAGSQHFYTEIYTLKKYKCKCKDEVEVK